LGEAFQLRDDILGVFGDPKETGKPAGDDLREGKRTVLIATATEHATPAQSEQLRRGLGDPGLDLDGVARIREVIVETGALQATESLIEQLLERSLEALHAMNIDANAREVLTGLAYAATRRSV
jgi:geranylgeranyl diphosphate synthase type I